MSEHIIPSGFLELCPRGTRIEGDELDFMSWRWPLPDAGADVNAWIRLARDIWRTVATEDHERQVQQARQDYERQVLEMIRAFHREQADRNARIEQWATEAQRQMVGGSADDA